MKRSNTKKTEKFLQKDYNNDGTPGYNESYVIHTILDLDYYRKKRIVISYLLIFFIVVYLFFYFNFTLGKIEFYPQIFITFIVIILSSLYLTTPYFSFQHYEYIKKSLKELLNSDEILIDNSSFKEALIKISKVENVENVENVVIPYETYIINKAKEWANCKGKRDQAVRLGYFFIFAFEPEIKHESSKEWLKEWNKVLCLKKLLRSIPLIVNSLSESCRRSSESNLKNLNEIRLFFEDIKWMKGIELLDTLVADY